MTDKPKNKGGAHRFATALAVLRTQARAGLGLSALIACAACSPDAGKKPVDKLHECVDLRNGETFRFRESTVENHSALWGRVILSVVDEQGFTRSITNDSPLKCRVVSQL